MKKSGNSVGQQFHQYIQNGRTTFHHLKSLTTIRSQHNVLQIQVLAWDMQKQKICRSNPVNGFSTPIAKCISNRNTGVSKPGPS